MQVDNVKNIITNRARIEHETAREIYRGVSGAYGNMLLDARSTYLDVLTEARNMVNVVGTDEAIRQASEKLAQHEIAYSTYERKDGTVVHVPVDTGIRREIQNGTATELRHSQVFAIAGATTGYVEVSSTANARESHEEWQGQIYSVEEFEDACNVGDPVDGFGGYNCGHEIAVSLGPGFEGDRFRDPLEGTGLDTEEARAIIAKQRQLERDIRRLKSAQTVLKEAGVASNVTTALARKQSQLREFVSENSAITKRYRFRETNYKSAKVASVATAKLMDAEEIERLVEEVQYVAESLPKAKSKRRQALKRIHEAGAIATAEAIARQSQGDV